VDKRLLITGYSGFVGKNLLGQFQSEFEMSGLSRTTYNKPGQLKEVYTWDKLTLEQLNQTDCIIHLAGKAHDLKNTSDASEYFKVNTELTKTLFNLFLKSTAMDFIYMSSVKAVADLS
jgi:nucleoside-diphosphate-sugar epimerase